MESGPGGLGPVASEPGKGSFPLPFLPPGGGTTALTAQTRVGAERRGRRCCLLHRFRVPPAIPPPPTPTPPRSSPKLSGRHLSALHRTARGCARAHAAAQPAPSPLPKRSAGGPPWCSLGQPSWAAPVTIRGPPTLSPSPAPRKGCSALLPGLFPGPSPPGPPQWLLFPLGFPDPRSGSPQVANIPALHGTSRATIDSEFPPHL